jgi:hypothetical protein
LQAPEWRRARRRVPTPVTLDPVTERLDEEKLELLREWGEGLTSDQRDEVRAAGRAIQLLIEEIERLHVDLWHATQTLAAQGADVEPEAMPAAAEATPAVDLAQRLRARFSKFGASA